MPARPTVGDRIYRVLLRLYPASFQEEFGADMALDFADASDDAWRQQGWRGLVALWLRTGSDLGLTLTAQWVRASTLLVVFAASSIAVSTVSAVAAIAPGQQFAANVSPTDRDLAAILLLTTSVLLIIAATILLNICLLRPLLQRRAQGPGARLPAARSPRMPLFKL